jgi:hypothetical protein
MNNILEKICADKRLQVEADKLLKPFEMVHQEALEASPVRGFSRRLRDFTGR